MEIIRNAIAMAGEGDAEDNHPEGQKVIVHGGDGVNDIRHVSKHSDHPGCGGKDAEVADPAWELRAARQHGETGQKEEQAEAQLSQELSDVIPEEAVQAREDCSDR